MNIPSIWGQGQIFAFSGLDGKTDFADGLCGYLSGKKTKSELSDKTELAIFKDGVTL